MCKHITKNIDLYVAGYKVGGKFTPQDCQRILRTMENSHEISEGTTSLILQYCSKATQEVPYNLFDSKKNLQTFMLGFNSATLEKQHK